MPNLRPGRNKRYEYLSKNGFTRKEALELSSQYSMAQFRSLPYLSTMIRTRRLYGTSLAAKGYDWPEIQRSIAALYQKKGWVDPDGRASVWAMLRSFRKQIISSGGDPSPGFPPKRSHHSRAEITQSELRAQQRQLEKQRDIDRSIWGR